MGRLAGTFADPLTFAEASSFVQNTPLVYEVPFGDFTGGQNLGPYRDPLSATNDVINLLRQHFNLLARSRGLAPVEFANKDVGWFFKDGLLPANKIAFDAPDGRSIRRAMSGKFKDLRWHVCILAKPRIWPELTYRMRANVVLSADGNTPLAGENTHRRRRRVTKSWWNDVWRDRLLAAMNYLASGSPAAAVGTGSETFEISAWPVSAEVPVSYDAIDLLTPREEDEDGNITPTSALDDQIDDFEEEDAAPDRDREDDAE
jgi:hypothetical protein